MVASTVLRVRAVAVSVCVCRKLVFRRNGWTDRAGFGMDTFFDVSHTVNFKEIWLLLLLLFIRIKKCI